MAEAKTGDGALWGARFASGPSAELARLSRSTHFDWQLAPYDIAGSHAHAKALAAAGYLSSSEETAMHAGLDELQRRVQFEAVATAGVLTCMLTVAWGMLEMAGFPKLPIVLVTPLFSAAYGFGIWRASRKYQ